MVVSSPIHNVCLRDLMSSGLCSELGIATRTVDKSQVMRTAVDISREVCRRFSAN
jgi:hypothetical protein